MEEEIKKIGEQSINILGTYYRMRYDDGTDPYLKANSSVTAYTDQTSHEIVLRKDLYENLSAFNDVDDIVRKVVRHEIVHAFLFESGITMGESSFHSEEMVEWLAVQLPKMSNLFESLGVLK